MYEKHIAPTNLLIKIGDIATFIRNIFQNVLYWIEFLRTINERHQAQQAPKKKTYENAVPTSS
jgi:hypothetical protein